MPRIGRIVELVVQAAQLRLDLLLGHSRVLVNDMQSALHRMETHGARANLGDIRVGGWLRASTELHMLQWFQQLADDHLKFSVPEIREVITEEIRTRLMVLEKQSDVLAGAMKITLDMIDELHRRSWDDIRVAPWYRASTELRVLKWLASSCTDLINGLAPSPFDLHEQSPDQDEEVDDEGD